MSNTTGEDGPCVRENISARSDGYRYYAIFYTTVNLVVVIVSLVLWLKFRRSSAYLHNRNFSSICVGALGFISDIATGALTRTSTDEHSFTNSCFLSTFPYTVLVPCLFLAGILRVLLFLNRYHYNKNLSDSFEASSYSRAKISHTESSRILKQLRRKAQGSFATKIALVGFAIICILGLISTAQSCPEFGISTKCQVAGLADSYTYNWTIVVLMFIVVGFIYYVHQKTQQYPDPFGILSEVRTVIIFSSLIIFPAGFLGGYDVGNFAKRNPQRFSFNLVFDYGILFVFYYSVPYQIYLGTKVLKNSVVLKEITLEKLLENDIGRALFRQHLVNEFSVENINFVEAVDAYRSLFDEDADETLIMQSAALIIETFIQEDAASPVNISGYVSSQLTEVLLTGKLVKNQFDHVYNEVFNLMESDSFPRFRSTYEFKNYIGETEAMAVL